MYKSITCYITHEIFEAFDCIPSLEVMSVLLDISEAFDKVWHQGLLYKLKSMGISGELYNLLTLKAQTHIATEIITYNLQGFFETPS